MRPVFLEVKIKERFTYEWTCPACGEDALVRTSVVKVFLSCPICGLTHRRDGIASSTWRILGERKPERVPLDLEMEVKQ